MNYNEEMKKIIKGLDGRKSLLLHSCCGPCSSSVIERLKNYFDITVLYYNPNIEPKEEYEKRKREQIRLLKILGVSYYDIDYLMKSIMMRLRVMKMSLKMVLDAYYVLI